MLNTVSQKLDRSERRRKLKNVVTSRRDTLSMTRFGKNTKRVSGLQYMILVLVTTAVGYEVPSSLRVMVIIIHHQLVEQ